MRIMIVEDNAAMRKVLAAVFTGAGHEVVGAFADGNGLEEKIPRLTPQMICLDYDLPGRDGLAILESIQSLATSLDVLFMTASGDSSLEAKAADAGASGFIRKPFSQTQIVDELRAVVENRRLADLSASKVCPASTKAELASGRGRKGMAVIADDNGSVRLVLKSLLEESGLKVVQSAATGVEAVQAARTHKPRVLCLDINMPVMGGMEALPLIREASPDTQVVMVTGAVDKKIVTEAAALGAVGYIIKPLRPVYVEAFLRKLLGT